MGGVIQYRYDTSDDIHQLNVDEGEIMTGEKIIKLILYEVFGEDEPTCNLKCLNPGGNPLIMQRTFHQRFKPQKKPIVNPQTPPPPPPPVPIPIPYQRKRRWRSRSPRKFRHTYKKRWVSPNERRGRNNKRRRKRNRRF